jgi:site-specific recombinase XerD
MNRKEILESQVMSFLEALRNVGYSESSIRQYQKTYKSFLMYMEFNSIETFNSGVISLYLGTLPGENTLFKRNSDYRLSMFNNYFSDGIIRKPVVKYVVREFSGEIGNTITKFLSTLEEKRFSGRTIDGYERILSYFMRHLSLREVHHLCNIDESDVLSFIASSQNSKERPLSTMRLFYRYLYEQKHIDRNIEYVIGKSRYIVKEKLPSIYDPEEIRQIEFSVNQASPVGKRDYALLLLATRLGLRVSDIAGLQFSNVDWDRNIIRLIQFKTKSEIELPLLNDVGEAIINYLKFGRPHSSSQQIFLSSLVPYNPANGAVISRAIRNIISLSDVCTRNRKTGPHAMRHTLASRLLHNGVALPVISEALGHKNTQTTMAYLRIDIDGLMKCTLDVPCVPSDFYTQKGGMFYV